MTSGDFAAAFTALTGNAPFPWQERLYGRFLAADIPAVCDIPTGLGKTSVIAVWFLARSAGASIPRRLVYVVNRRTVVDQTTVELRRLRDNREKAGIVEDLAVSTLRGQMADNRAWSADPSKPAAICGTVDMIGSRLLFSGYRIGFRTRPLHAGFLGQDALLVHDEAHLEPAFQRLLETIQSEQARGRDPWPLQVMALTATSRDGRAAFALDADDQKHPVVAKRLNAPKKLVLHTHGDRDLVESVVQQALAFASAAPAVLVFLRTVDDVMTAAARLRKAGAKVQLLTGTMRGFERDRLVADDEVFARFLPDSRATKVATESAYLVCTSAGEVGVNLSADHLVCDLSTFDSMAQRFGRVNRFGFRDDTETHVFHPADEALESDKLVDTRRQATLQLLRALDGDASPAGLGSLDAAARRAAYAPEPQILPATDVLFDAWAMTTVRGRLPGRPPVAPYLHGVTEWEPPSTQVAWRMEVQWVTKDLESTYPPNDLLEDYPLKPHELLTDRTSRVVDTLETIVRAGETIKDDRAWLVQDDGSVTASSLEELIEGDRKAVEARLGGCTLILSPKTCRPVDGLFSEDGARPSDTGGIDVADAWLGDDGKPRRARRADDEEPPKGMRLIRRIVLREDAEEAADAAPLDATTAPRLWSWYEIPLGADDEGSRSATKPVLLDVHSADVEREAARIVADLTLDEEVKQAVVLAGRLHDIGKVRWVWQRSIGNSDRSRILAKSGGAMRPLDATSYRHELGSIVDAERDRLLEQLSASARDLALHLVAAHHGRARPHFPAHELFDPEARGIDPGEVGARVLVRFASLQKRFGRWGLAYLESLVRAADYAASAQPSKMEEVNE